MEFRIGDLVVLNDERVEELIKSGKFDKNYFRALNISEIINFNNKRTSLFLKINLERKSIYPFPSEHYRLATENEIKAFKLKKIFVNRKNGI